MGVAKMLILCLLVLKLREISGHGRLMDPVNRSNAWRKGFQTPRNYTDNEGFCGGATVQHENNGGKCRVCGDDFGLARPRPNANNGEYRIGTIVRRYVSGQTINIAVDITATHQGFFRFALCPLRTPKELEEENCFIPLKFSDGSTIYDMENSLPGIKELKVKLPPGLKCKSCVLRWEYVAGNTWGVCENGESNSGSGPQETFRTCSDITIK